MTDKPRLTAEERAEARRLADAATPGPWRADVSTPGLPHELHYDVTAHDHLTPKGSGMRVSILSYSHMPQRDHAFIAASRTLVPKLLDALEAAERERDTARAQVATLTGRILNALLD